MNVSLQGWRFFIDRVLGKSINMGIRVMRWYTYCISAQ